MDKSGEVIEMACLGRPFRLGMLYDCRSDKLIPGITLWDDERLKSALDSREQVGSDFEVIAEDSLESKASKLDISASLKLSFMGGLVKVSGSAKYLDDRKSSKHQSRVSLKYWSTSRFDQLTMEQLGNIQYPKVFSNKIATHVVAGVLYGADAFFVFDRRIEGSENVRNVQGKVEALVKALPGIAEIKGNADLDMNEEDKKAANRLECKFHGDLQLPKNPTAFQEAVQVFQELPDLLKGDNGPRVIPKKVWLHPLSNLSSEAAKVVHEISTSLVSQAQKVMEELLDYEMQCNDLMNTQVCSSFSSLQTQLSRFKGMILQYRLEVSKKLTRLLPSIREGGMEEAQLADVFKSKEASPFSAHQLKTWLQSKEREVNILDKYVEALQEIKCIEFALTAGSLDRIVNDLKFDYVVSFNFQMLTSNDPDLDRMQVYLDTQTPSAQQQSTPWFKNKKTMAAMRKHVRQFTTFARANENHDGVKFVVANNSDENDDSFDKGTAILLFEDGISEEFEPPVSPDHVKPAKDGITHSSILLEWSKPEYGSDSVQQYTVCYGLKEEPTDQWKSKTTTDKETSITIDGLQPAKSYCVKVRAECEAGVSEYSKVSNPILTQLPNINALKYVSDHLPGTRNQQIYKLVGDECTLPGTMARKVTIGEPMPGYQEKVLMVVGATGAGKSTLINGMINYILGVQWKDDFRFKLITDEAKCQAHSQTSAITAYTIHHMEGSRVDYNLTIIDTPGFGDTSGSGLKRDNMITEQIKEFFSIGGHNGISHLDGIGFVTQSDFVCLTLTQKYIFDSILSIFGKDVAKNIFMMVTFTDGQTPPVLQAIEDCDNIIPYSGYFKFNNSCLFHEPESSDDDGSDDEEDTDCSFDEMYWKMGVRSFESFFTAFQKAESVSLTMTKEVLEHRERLQLALIGGLQRRIQDCLSELPTSLRLFGAHAQLSMSDTVKYWRLNGVNKLEKSYTELQKSIDAVNSCLIKLNEIALKPIPLTQQVYYIEYLIEFVKRQAQEGWSDRVDYLYSTLEQAKLLAVIDQGIDNIDQRISDVNSQKWEEILMKLIQVKHQRSTRESQRDGSRCGMAMTVKQHSKHK